MELHATVSIYTAPLLIGLCPFPAGTIDSTFSIIIHLWSEPSNVGHGENNNAVRRSA